MNPILAFSIIFGYFSVLIGISWLTSRKSDSHTFFTANRRSPWYLVAFSMIGTTISGVTFISVPGEVGKSAFSYFQFIMGNLAGYWVVAGILLPLYYKLNLVSIYSFLNHRFGKYSYKTGSFFFLLSRVIGASFRLFLAVMVLQLAFFDAFSIPFTLTVAITIFLIWLYTYRGGIKTIIWTDSLQTILFITSVILTIITISKSLGFSFSTLVSTIYESPHSQIFFWDWRSGSNFFKQFLSGIFITIVMVGLDQDMMQKNLTCKTRKDSQKNMFVFSFLFVGVVFLFLCLGALLYIYAEKANVSLPARSDNLFPLLAFNYLGIFTGLAFLVGIIAANCSSADSALTALTTSFCYDFLSFGTIADHKKSRMRKIVHLSFSVVLIIVILIFRAINDESVVVAVFRVAGYTYGPLLGMFAFGILTRRNVSDKLVPYVCFSAPVICYFIARYSAVLFNGYQFGFELLILNGFLTFLGLLGISEKNVTKT
jgi:solute:Na+ symporter, SSS family